MTPPGQREDALPRERFSSLARCGANGAGGLLCPGNSDVNLFRYGKGIINLDAEVPDGTFDLCMPVRGTGRPLRCATDPYSQRRRGGSGSGGVPESVGAA
jgi:hypothetical protein